MGLVSDYQNFIYLLLLLHKIEEKAYIFFKKYITFKQQHYVSYKIYVKVYPFLSIIWYNKKKKKGYIKMRILA